jgi:hypothetical protein
MDTKHTEIKKSLQVLLWIWFGTMTSFVATNVVNVAKLENQTQMTQEQIQNLEKRILLLKYHSTSN